MVAIITMVVFIACAMITSADDDDASAATAASTVAVVALRVQGFSVWCYCIWCGHIFWFVAASGEPNRTPKA